MLDKITLAVLGAVLGYAAFEWGGVLRTTRYGCLLALGLVGIALSLARSRREWAPVPGGVVRWAAGLLPLYVLLQVVPLPESLLRVLSPERASAVEALGALGARLSFAPLSASPARTFQYFLLVCGYITVFLLARELVWRFKQRRWLAIGPIVAIGALEAGLGLWQYFGGTLEQAQGTYVNRNHYAGFLEMALPFAVMCPLAILRTGRSGTRPALTRSVVACSLWSLAAAMLLGIIYSFSRMGFFAALGALFVIGLLTFGYRPLGWVSRSRKRRWCAAGFLGAAVLASFIFLPPDKLILRFAQMVSVEGLTAEGRIQLWAETVPLIKAYPVFGCGLGGYENAVLRFKTSEPLLTDNFAHNDYLQLLAELGLAGCIILGALAFSLVKAALRVAVMSPDREQRYLGVACAGSLVAILLHSLVDFNLYIPANAMLLAWVGGIIAGNNIPTRRGSGWEWDRRLNVITVEPVQAVSLR
jgi:O-antigen ligase